MFSFCRQINLCDHEKLRDRILNVFAEATSGAENGANTASLFRAKGYVSGPLSDSLTAGVSGSFTKKDEIAINLVPGIGDLNEQNRYALRGQLYWEPSDRLDLRLMLASRTVMQTRVTQIYSLGPHRSSSMPHLVLLARIMTRIIAK